MTKAKPRLVLVRPHFKVAEHIRKATAKDAVVLVPLEEYIALVKAASETKCH